MGTRYLLTVTCPVCGFFDDDVYYAPTCGFLTWECGCGHVVDLGKLTGISYEEASNVEEIRSIIGERQWEPVMDRIDKLVELVVNLLFVVFIALVIYLAWGISTVIVQIVEALIGG